MTDIEFREFERRLDNWRLVVTMSGGQGHCGSAESFYNGRAPGEGGSSACIDVLDGWNVENAWKTISSPHYRWQLKMHYIQRADQRHVIRAVLHHTKHAIKRWHYRAELFQAVSQLRKALDILYRQSHHSISQLEQVPSVISERCVAERPASLVHRIPKPAAAR